MPEAGMNLNFSIIDVSEYLPLLGRCCGWCIHIFLAVTLTCSTILYRKQQLLSAWRCLLYTLPTGVLLTSCQKSQEWQRVRILAVALNQWLQGLKEKLPQLPCPSLEVTRKDVLCPHPELGANGQTPFTHTITSLTRVLHWLFFPPLSHLSTPQPWLPRIRIISQFKLCLCISHPAELWMIDQVERETPQALQDTRTLFHWQRPQHPYHQQKFLCPVWWWGGE